MIENTISLTREQIQPLIKLMAGILRSIETVSLTQTNTFLRVLWGKKPPNEVLIHVDGRVATNKKRPGMALSESQVAKWFPPPGDIVVAHASVQSETVSTDTDDEVIISDEDASTDIDVSSADTGESINIDELIEEL